MILIQISVFLARNPIYLLECPEIGNKDNLTGFLAAIPILLITLIVLIIGMKNDYSKRKHETRSS